MCGIEQHAVALNTYLNAELFPLEFKGQVLMVRQLTCETVKVRHLAYVEQACERFNND